MNNVGIMEPQDLQKLYIFRSAGTEAELSRKANEGSYHPAGSVDILHTNRKCVVQNLS